MSSSFPTWLNIIYLWSLGWTSAWDSLLYCDNLVTESKWPTFLSFKGMVNAFFLASHQASFLHDFWSVCWMNFATQIPSFWTLVLCCHAGPMAFGKLQCIGSCQQLKIQGMSTGFQCRCGRWGPGTWSRNQGESVRNDEPVGRCPFQVERSSESIAYALRHNTVLYM